MRLLLGLASAFLLASLLLAADPPTAPQIPQGDDQDIIYLHTSRPYLLRIHVSVDGKPYYDRWESFIRELFKFLDVNGDGVLTPKELACAPSENQLIQQFQGAAQIDPGPAPQWKEVDIAPADGKVSLAEFIAYYRRSIGGPLQIEWGRRQAGFMDQVSDRLFEHLDRNKDGKLSRDELRAARETLAVLDTDDDETVSAGELVGAVGASAGGIPVSFDPMPDSFPFILHQPSLAAAHAKRLLAHYDKNKDGKLGRAEIAFEHALFTRLDRNNDGFLDESELTKWFELGPDLEFSFELGRSGKKTVTPIGPLASTAHTTPDGMVILNLVQTQLDVQRRPMQEKAREVQALKSLLAGFKSLDANNDGFLDGKEIFQPPFRYVPYLRLADRDGDGRLSQAELKAYVALMEKALIQVTVLTIEDRGRALFETLDTDRDGRLSPRELNNAWTRMATWDRNGDGFITKEEIPHQFHLTLGFGPSRIGDARDGQVMFFPPSRNQPRNAGPLWFRKMDRNNDGDVSRREFLGTEEDFKKIDLDGDGLISPEEAEKADAWMRKKLREQGK